MALATATLGGSAWYNSIMNLLHAAFVGNGGFPIAMRTRAVPSDKPLLITENKDGVLLATFDSIPLYTNGSSDKDDIDFMYPDGTWTDVVIEQET